MRRRQLLAGLLLPALGTLIAVPTPARAETGIEQTHVTIAVGGKNLLYYLPLTIAERLGYFKDEGLDVEIVDFAGGSKALQAVVGGSADVVSGAFEHTINLQAKGQFYEAFVLQGRAPQIVVGVSNKTLPGYQSIADLKGRKIGVTAPGSSTNIITNYVLARGGLKPADVSFIGVGAGSGAIAALRSGQIDAIANLDPVASILLMKSEIRVISDTRKVKESQALFGGNLPAGCLYASSRFIAQKPHTTQALANAMVRALKWLQKAGPTDLTHTVPESYQLGDKALYLKAFQDTRDALSPDGIIPADGPKTALSMLEKFEPALQGKAIDASKLFTNTFAQRANAKYK